MRGVWPIKQPKQVAARGLYGTVLMPWRQRCRFLWRQPPAEGSVTSQEIWKRAAHMATVAKLSRSPESKMPEAVIGLQQRNSDE